MQRTLPWLVCMICTCDLFSHFTFYAHDPKCLQRRHWHISKRRLTFRFLRCPLHCSHTGPSLLSCVCFLFGSEWDCHPGCHVATPYWSLGSKSSPQGGGVQPQSPSSPASVRTLSSSQHSTPQLWELLCPLACTSTVCTSHWAVSSSGRVSVVR